MKTLFVELGQLYSDIPVASSKLTIWLAYNIYINLVDVWYDG